jgi:hypothetical protein
MVVVILMAFPGEFLDVFGEACAKIAAVSTTRTRSRCPT